MSRSVRLGLALLVALASFAVGCSLQAEGDRCSVANASGDCESPLVCTKRELLTASTVDRCCPADRSTATTAECAVTFTGNVDAGSSPTEPLVDAGSSTADAGASDSGTGDSATADAN